MSFDALGRVLRLLSDFDVRLGGGWGVDVLVGHQTRYHHDVDLFVPVDEVDPAAAMLVRAGYAIVSDDAPCRVVLEDASRGRIDLNGIAIFGSGDAFQHDGEGGFELFPANCWTEVSIGALAIVCLTSEAQRIKRGGYPARDVDRHDLATLEELDPLTLTGDYLVT